MYVYKRQVGWWVGGEVEGGKTTIKMLFGVTSYEKHQLCATSHKLREPIAKGYLTSFFIII